METLETESKLEETDTKASTSSEEEKFELELNYFDDKKQEDKLWMARTGLNEETLCGAIETVIFMSDRPLALDKIKNLIDEDLPLRVLHRALSYLQEGYESKHHGIRLVEVAEGYQFRTKATYSQYVQDLFKVNSLVLSPTALEVLAIVAYKQPVAKTEVDKIRGVDSGHIIRGLMDKRLVRVVGRSQEMGRPVLYGTTSEFLEVFNLASIDELPPEYELETMLEEGVGKTTDIKTLVYSGDKKRFVFDEMDELDKLAESIKTISVETDFTVSLKSEEKKKGEGVDGALSAFDLLEEYVSRQLIADVNKEAQNSEPISETAEPHIIGDLTAGPFNVPDFVEEDGEFQMIDLETGFPLESEVSSQELELDQSRLEEAVEKLGEKTHELADEAKDLDLDLEFLKTSGNQPPENNTDS